MYNGLLHAHSGLRYVVLILIVLVIFQSFTAWRKKHKFDRTHKVLANMSAGMMVVQFLIGVVLYFLSPKVLFDAETMKSTILRFFTLEHPLLMLISCMIIVHGVSKAKAYSNYDTHKQLFWSHLIGLVLIIISIPWPFRSSLGAGWF